jgi:hypothetical protein
MKVIIFFLLIQFVLNKRIQESNYCFDSKGCSKEYHFKCSGNVCSKNKLSCQSLKLWAIAKNHINTEKANRTFGIFFQMIKMCPKWNPNDVCLNNAVCHQNTLLPHRMWLIGKISIIKETKCKCIEKYIYTCGKDQKYCSIDEGGCQRMNASEPKIKNCKK